MFHANKIKTNLEDKNHSLMSGIIRLSTTSPITGPEINERVCIFPFPCSEKTKLRCFEKFGVILYVHSMFTENVWNDDYVKQNAHFALGFQ